MHVTSSILLGIALAMDCFTVSVASGACAKRVVIRPMLSMVLLFGLFQGGMTWGGWYVSTLFSHILEPIDHWIAFILLAYLGIQMIREGRRPEEEHKFDPLKYKVILTLAVATSIDALAVGVSLSCMSLQRTYEIGLPVGIIALCSSLFTVAGLTSGILLGRRIPFRTEPIGGLILIGIGVKIMIEHLT